MLPCPKGPKSSLNGSKAQYFYSFKASYECFVLEHSVFRTKHLRYLVRDLIQDLVRDFEWVEILGFTALDSYSKRIRQKCYQYFINKELKKTFHFLTCILPNYVPHEITKEVWKNSQFENITAGFLLSCQNSLRREIGCICHWNIDSWKQKLPFGYVMFTKRYQKII